MATTGNVSLVIGAVDNASAVLQQIGSNIQNSFSSLDSMSARMGQRLAGNMDISAAMQGVGTLGNQMLSALQNPITAAMEFENKLADVKKVVDFEQYVGGVDAYSNKILEMSKEIPVAASGLLEISAAGGQLGVATKDLEGFVRVVAKASTAFDMTADKAGDSMAKIQNIFGLQTSGLENMGDIVNKLADSTAASATGMIDVLARTGGTAQAFGFGVQQTAALASAFLSIGKTSEIASTGINAILMKLKTATSQGGKFQDGLAEIGYDAKDLETAIGQDAQGALYDFLATLKNVDKDSQLKIMGNMFGLEYADDIAALVGGLDNLDKAFYATGDKSGIEKSLERLTQLDPGQQLSKLTDFLSGNENLAKQALDMKNVAGAAELIAKNSSGFKGSMQKEFEARSATTANALQLLQSRVTAVAITVGSLLLPTARLLIGYLSYVVDKVNLWLNANLELVKNVALVTGVIGGVLVGIAFFGNTLSAVTSAIVALSTAVALLASPFMISMGILAFGAYRMYRSWTLVSSFLQGFAQGFNQAFSPIYTAIDGLSAAFLPISQALATLFQPFISGLHAVLQPLIHTTEMLNLFGMAGEDIGTRVGKFIAGGLGVAINYLTNFITQYQDVGVNIVKSLAVGITTAKDYLYQAILSVFDFVDALFPHSPAEAGPWSLLYEMGYALIATFADGVGWAGGYLWQSIERLFTVIATKFPGLADFFTFNIQPLIFSFADQVSSAKTFLWQKFQDIYSYPFELLPGLISRGFYALGQAILGFITLPLTTLANFETVLTGSTIVASLTGIARNSTTLQNSWVQLGEGAGFFALAMTSIKYAIQSTLSFMGTLFTAIRTWNFSVVAAQFFQIKSAVMGFNVTVMSTQFGFSSIATAALLTLPFLRTFISTLFGIGNVLFILPIMRPIIALKALAATFGLFRNSGTFLYSLFGLLDPVSKKGTQALTGFKTAWASVFSATSAGDKAFASGMTIGLFKFIRGLGFLKGGLLIGGIGLFVSALDKAGFSIGYIAQTIRDSLFKSFEDTIAYFQALWQWFTTKPQIGGLEFDLSPLEQTQQYLLGVWNNVVSVLTNVRDFFALVIQEVVQRSGEIATAFAPAGVAMASLMAWFYKFNDVRSAAAFINVAKNAQFLAQVVAGTAAIMGVATYVLINYSGSIIRGFDTAIRSIFDFMSWFDQLSATAQKAMLLVGGAVAIGAGLIALKLYNIFRKRDPMQEMLEYMRQSHKAACGQSGAPCGKQTAQRLGIIGAAWEGLKSTMLGIMAIPMMVANAFGVMARSIQLAMFGVRMAFSMLRIWAMGHITTMLALYRAQQAGTLILSNVAWTYRIGFAFIWLGNIIKTHAIAGFLRFKAVAMGMPMVATAVNAVTLAFGWMGRAAQLAFFMSAMGMNALKLALLANQVGAIIAGVTLLAGLAYVVYRNWDSIRTFFADLWSGVTGYFQGFINWLNDVMPGLGTIIKAPFSALHYFVTETFTNIVSGLYALITGDFYGVGMAIINTLAAGATAVGSLLYDVIVGIFQMVRNLMPFSPAKEGPFSDLDISGQRIILTLVDGVMSVGSFLYDAISNIFTTVTDFFATLNWYDVGSSLIGGLAAGMTAAMGLVTQAASQVTESARKNIPFYDKSINAFSQVIGSVMGEPTVATTDKPNQPVINQSPIAAQHSSPITPAIPAPTASINGKQSGQAMVTTLSDGMKQETPTIVSTISGVTQAVAEYLSFSNAKKGAFSRLTYSGGMIPGTLAQGVEKNTDSLVSSVAESTKLASETIESGISDTSATVDIGVTGLDSVATAIDNVLTLKNGLAGVRTVIRVLPTIGKTVALASNPVGQVALGVMGIADASYLVYENWDTIKETTNDVVETTRKNVSFYDNLINSTSQMIGSVMGEPKAPDVTGVSYFKQPIPAKAPAQTIPQLSTPAVPAIKTANVAQPMVNPSDLNTSVTTPNVAAPTLNVAQPTVNPVAIQAPVLPNLQSALEMPQLTAPALNVATSPVESVAVQAPKISDFNTSVTAPQIATPAMNVVTPSVPAITTDVTQPAFNPLPIQAPVLPNLQSALEMPQLTAPALNVATSPVESVAVQAPKISDFNTSVNPPQLTAPSMNVVTPSVPAITTDVTQPTFNPLPIQAPVQAPVLPNLNTTVAAPQLTAPSLIVAQPTMNPVAVQAPALSDLQTSVEMPQLQAPALNVAQPTVNPVIAAPQPNFTNFEAENVATQQITNTDSTKSVTRRIEDSLEATQRSSKVVDVGKSLIVRMMEGVTQYSGRFVEGFKSFTTKTSETTAKL
jgi:TP901 family phage tail tape measure protein